MFDASANSQKTKGTIEVNLCNRDAEGNKVDGFQKPMFINVKPEVRRGVIVTPEVAGEMVARGKVG